MSITATPTPSTPKLTVVAAAERAIARYGDTNITVAQLADIAGFTDQEKAFAVASWTLIYTNEWIYLSDEIIINQLTTETGKDAIHDFIKRDLLIPEHIYGHDYARVLPDGTILGEQGEPTTEFDITFYSANLPNRIYSNRKQYFIVSPDCMKSLLQKASTKRGSETRGYFLKVEKLAAIMREYMIRIGHMRTERAIEAEKHTSQLAIEETKKTKEAADKAQVEADKAQAEAKEAQAKADAEIARMKLCEIHMNAMRFPLDPMKPDGRIYIATSAFYEQHHTFKIGRTGDIGSVRLQQYKTGRTSTDRFRYLYLRDCYETKATENKIKRALKPYLEEPTATSSEMFIIGFEDLRTLVDMCIDHSTRECTFLNDRWARRKEIVERFDILPTIPSVDPETSQSAISSAPQPTPVAPSAAPTPMTAAPQLCSSSRNEMPILAHREPLIYAEGYLDEAEWGQDQETDPETEEAIQTAKERARMRQTSHTPGMIMPGGVSLEHCASSTPSIPAPPASSSTAATSATSATTTIATTTTTTTTTTATIPIIPIVAPAYVISIRTKTGREHKKLPLDAVQRIIECMREVEKECTKDDTIGETPNLTITAAHLKARQIVRYALGLLMSTSTKGCISSLMTHCSSATLALCNGCSRCTISGIGQVLHIKRIKVQPAPAT